MVAEENISIHKDQLIKARESLGLSRKEVADKLGIDEQQLVNWETGESQPSLESLWDLAEYYERGTDYFLFRP